jgi:GTP-binding protein
LFDTAEITVKAGDGGNGAIGFRHEKYVPFGGPDGGDGGAGGNVVLMADASITNLLTFRRRGFHKADRGGNGRGSKKHGKRGDDLILKVPVGTMVVDPDRPPDDNLVGDLEHPNDRVIVARGGRGGRGNTHFASSTNQTPQIAQRGTAGEERALSLELRLIADVGIIGYPNVGKSTLLSAASAAKPEVAAYPFTTKEPIVGVVEVGMETFVLAEIPGLIEGAHMGRGLGHDFLRHATRTRAFIHVIDSTSASPAEDLTRVNAELGMFDAALARKPQMVAINKIDLPGAQEAVATLRAALSSIGIAPVAISAATGEGVPELMAHALATLKEVPGKGKEAPEKVFRPQPRRQAVTVSREGDAFVVTAPALERLVASESLDSPGMRQQLNRQLARLGINRALEKAGARPGDRVRCGAMEWEW